MAKRATLKDIAKALNLSVTTVSRALNDKDDISSKTKKAVAEVAKLLDYKPNLLAVSLRKNQSSDLIGIILPSVNHYFFSTILKGIMHRAHEAGHLVMVGESNQDPNKEKDLVNQFGEHFVSGVIMAPSNSPDSLKTLERLELLKIPYVLIDQVQESFDGSQLTNDDFDGAYQATEHLIKQGFKRVAYLSGKPSCGVSSRRRMGYLTALENNGVSKDEQLLQYCENEATKEEGYRLTQILFEQNTQNPDAIFAVSDTVALGVYKYAHENNICIPEDLGIIGYSNSDISQYLSPPLSTVEQNGMTMGQKSYDFLMDLKESKRINKKSFSAKLIARGSTVK